MLDLIEHRLMTAGTRCVKLGGSMSLDARDRIITSFTSDASIPVFLLSLKAGGVALNLTAASHVMLMDPVRARAPAGPRALLRFSPDIFPRTGGVDPLARPALFWSGRPSGGTLRWRRKRWIGFTD